MTALLAIVLALLILRGGWLPGFAALAAALWLFARGCGVAFTPAQLLVFGALLLMVPAAAYIAGFLLDRFAWRTIDGGAFAGIALGFAAAAALRSDLLPRFIESAFLIAHGQARPLVLFAGAVNATLLCAAVVALSIMVIQLVIELPFRWLQGATRASVVMPFSGLRPLLVCLMLTMLVHHIAGMFAVELRPDRALKVEQGR